MARPKPIFLLYFTAEQWPTFRPDVVALFGKYLPRLGVGSDLVTERDVRQPHDRTPWGGGSTLLCNVPRHRAGQYVAKFLHQLRGLLKLDALRYDAVQVRDMPMVALLALMMARLKGVPFFYWMSFLQSEGQVQRARARGMRAGMRYWFPLLQGTIGQWVLYRLVLPRADHVFVQSRRMAEDIAGRGIALKKMTPVPMGVDLDLARPENIPASDDPRLQGRRVLVYLGSLDRARNIETLFGMLRIVQQQMPEILLVLAGDTDDQAHRRWLQQEAERSGTADAILWTGWLPAAEAWKYVRAAEIGLSPIPRGYLLDCASPTKAVEYMALGIPVVGNDNPDQVQVVTESGGGFCVPLQADSFAGAVLELLSDPAQCRAMGARGRRYVQQTRGYGQLALQVAETYRQLLRGAQRSAP